MAAWLAPLIVVVVFVVIFAPITVRMIKEYERGVIFRFGRLVGARGPGLFFVIPFFESMTKVDLRITTLDIPVQEAITRDNVTVKVNAVISFRVLEPEAAIIKAANYKLATSELGQTTLRSVLGRTDLDDLLSQRDELNHRIRETMDERTGPWGVKIAAVDIKDVELPETLQRAMARQAEAERERRAKIIHAEGEFQAAQRLADASDIISTSPAALQLRYLQTLTEITNDRTTTLIFPLPVDLMTALTGMLQGATAKGPDTGPNETTPPSGAPASGA